jgi:hypothetical protein
VAQSVEALRYKTEGRGFDSWWCLGIFHLLNPFGRTMALGSTPPSGYQEYFLGVSVTGAEG